MNFLSLAAAICILCTTPSHTSDFDDITGTLIRHSDFNSAYVASRNIDVWLPPDYESKSDRLYPVLYMQDGQNLFDPELSYIGVDWGVDEALTTLITAGEVRPPIVVGIWNTPDRGREYMPQRPVDELKAAGLLPPEVKAEDLPIADEYLKFLVGELIPFIDLNFHTLTGPSDTFIMGSSMGGLISLYAVCEYPDVFGGAGCVSTHWPAGFGIVIDYMKKYLPKPGSANFYFDFGTETLDSEYEPYQHRADDVMRDAGYTEGSDWITVKYEGHEHSERAWRKRLHVPLRFLLGTANE